MISQSLEDDKAARPIWAALFGIWSHICVAMLLLLTSSLTPIFTLNVSVHLLIVFYFVGAVGFMDLARELYFNRSGRAKWFRPFGEAGLIAAGLFMAVHSIFVFTQLPGITIISPAFIFAALIGIIYLILSLSSFAALTFFTVTQQDKKDETKT